MKQLFDVIRKLVSDQTEIQGISLINWHEKSWEKGTPLNDRVVQLSTAKVSCMGRIHDSPESAWKEQIDWFMNSSQCRELDRIDGEPMELAWKVSQDSPHCTFSPCSLARRGQEALSNGKAETNNSGEGETTQLCSTQPVE